MLAKRAGFVGRRGESVPEYPPSAEFAGSFVSGRILPSKTGVRDMVPTPPRRTIREIQPGERIEDQIFLIAQKDLRTTTNGGLYIDAVLADATGQMRARMWNASQEMYESIPESGPMRVRGRVESYKGKLQFILEGVRQVAA